MSVLSDAFNFISNWMSANLLGLNPTKTEFLIIGRPQQLSKLTGHSLPLTCDISLTLVQQRPLGSAEPIGLGTDLPFLRPSA